MAPLAWLPPRIRDVTTPVKMLQKESRLRTNDRSGAGVMSIFHIYTLRQREVGRLGHYYKAAVKKLSRLPARIRGKRFRPIRRGFVVRFILNTSVRSSLMGNSMTLALNRTAGVLIKRRGALRSKYIFGPTQRPRVGKAFTRLFSKMYLRCY